MTDADAFRIQHPPGKLVRPVVHEATLFRVASSEQFDHRRVPALLCNEKWTPSVSSGFVYVDASVTVQQHRNDVRKPVPRRKVQRRHAAHYFGRGHIHIDAWLGQQHLHDCGMTSSTREIQWRLRSIQGHRIHIDTGLALQQHLGDSVVAALTGNVEWRGATTRGSVHENSPRGQQHSYDMTVVPLACDEHGGFAEFPSVVDLQSNIVQQCRNHPRVVFRASDHKRRPAVVSYLVDVNSRVRKELAHHVPVSILTRDE